MLHRRETLKALFGIATLPSVPVVARSISGKPQTLAILIQTSPIAGFQYYLGETVWDQIEVNDLLTLRRQPDNEYDANAIEVLWKQQKLGYVPRAENRVLSQMMDRGCEFSASVACKTDSPNPWNRLKIDVNLIIDLRLALTKMSDRSFSLNDF